MLVVETIAKIRRAYFIQGKSIKQICRELRVSRNTVRKVEGLRQEQERLVDDREAFLREFDESDYCYLIDRWDKKTRLCERGDLKWGLFVAM
jgi:hypothetical protein